MNDMLTANPSMIKMWSERTKCWMCKHRFDEPVILAVDKPERGKFQPHYNAKVAFHMQDTHGIPHEAVCKMILNSIYSIENTMQSVYGEKL